MTDAPPTGPHPILKGFTYQGSDQLLDEAGEHYDRKLLERAQELTQASKSGNLTLPAMKQLYALVAKAGYTPLMQRTTAHLRQHFKFTTAADRQFGELLEALPEAESPATAKASEIETPSPHRVEHSPAPEPELGPGDEAVIEPVDEPEPGTQIVSGPTSDEFAGAAPPPAVREGSAPIPGAAGTANSMRAITIDKVVINIGVGEGGERLLKAETVLKRLTAATPVRTISRSTNRDLGIRKGAPVGCKVTLRGQVATKVLTEALWVRENRIFDYSISESGCLSFGIPDYTGFANQKYDPDIGIFGLDLSVVLKRPGKRVTRRRLRRGRIGPGQRITREEAKQWLVENLQVEVIK